MRIMARGAMETPDGEWRVDTVRRPGTRTWWYRLTHGESVLEWLTIGEVQHYLAQAGVDLADLVEVQEGGPPPGEGRSTGAA